MVLGEVGSVPNHHFHSCHASDSWGFSRAGLLEALKAWAIWVWS
jgi:hypothetical protein